MAYPARRLTVAITHSARDTKAKVRRLCAYAPTVPACVDLVATDIAAFGGHA